MWLGTRSYDLELAGWIFLKVCNSRAKVVITSGIRVSELPAHCLCLSSSKTASATDGPPLSITVHLHPPLRGVSSSYQPNPELIWYIRKTRSVCKRYRLTQFMLNELRWKVMCMHCHCKRMTACSVHEAE